MKTLPTYTRGPWQCSTSPSGILVSQTTGEVIAQFEVAPTTDNARLIAAAPDLLTMCGMALDILLSNGYGETSHPVMNLRKVINQAIGE